MSKYAPLKTRSHYSLLLGLSKPEKIANRVEEIESDSCTLVDQNTLSGSINFLSKMKDKKKKAILGTEIALCRDSPTNTTNENKADSYITLVAKNTQGWKDLLEAVSLSNEKDRYYGGPRLHLDEVLEFGQKGNLLCYSGGVDSNISKELELEGKAGGIKLAQKLSHSFGENFFLEIQKDTKGQNYNVDILREVGSSTKIPLVSVHDSFYCNNTDAIDQRILLCSQMNSTIQQMSSNINKFSHFFKTDTYHIPSYEEMVEFGYTEEELANSLLFSDMVSEYDILRPPMLPNFVCPNGMNADEYITQLCRDGWREKIKDVIPTHKHQVYVDRVKHELEVIKGAGLSSYFLIIRDILEFCKQNGWLTGCGRGSASGCLVSYLIGVTGVEPIEYDLIFERFYNAGRNTADRISMPDIDIDVPKYSRDRIMDYLRKKYGSEKVGQMATFQTMKGRGAIKDVLRAYGGMAFEEMNEITKNIIEEHKISDELEQMKKEHGSSSIIGWCLENTPKKLSKWCWLNDSGDLEGPLASRFAQAIRLEGVKTARSKHPAGVVITPEPLHNICPIVYDEKTGLGICEFEMEDLENVGGLKLDILGLSFLDRTMGIAQDMAAGEVHEIQSA